MTPKASVDPDPQELENHLTILGSKIRIAIMQYLSWNNNLHDFGDIEVYLQSLFSESFKLSYHLKKLEDFNYIEKTVRGYELTRLGHQILPLIKNFEEIITNQTQISIRTSRYSLEAFQESVIEEKLIQEAEIPRDQAKSIAREARQRLTEAKVTYLTAPLIREYVNAILIERHMEDYRHKLTRLGLPPFDVKTHLQSERFHHPNEMMQFFGQNVWEQFTLLNILNQNYADLFLSGNIILGNLSHYSLTPLEFITAGSSLITQLQIFVKTELSPFFGKEEYRELFKLSLTEFISCFYSYLMLLYPFYPNGINLIRFDEFLFEFSKNYGDQHIKELWMQVFLMLPLNWPITLGISFRSPHFLIDPILDVYFDSLSYSIDYYKQFPVIQIHLMKEEVDCLLNTPKVLDLPIRLQKLLSLMMAHNLNLDQFSKWGEKDCEYLHSNLQIPIQFKNVDEIQVSAVLEKISINCFSLYNKFHEINSHFFKALETYLYRVFDYCERKAHLIEKNQKLFTHWHILDQIAQNSSDSPKYFVGISLHGLNELIFTKTNLEIKDQAENRKIAVKILKYVQKLCEKQNEQKPQVLNYSLADMHLHPSLIKPPNHIGTLPQNILFPSTSLHYKGFKYTLHYSEKPLTLEHLASIYNTFGQAKLPELSISTTFPSNLDIQKKDDWLKALQTLLQTNITRIGMSEHPSFWTTLEHPTKLNYSRYFGKIFTTVEFQQQFLNIS